MNLKHVVQVGQLSNMAVSAVIAGLMLSGMITYEYLVASAVVQGGINAIMMPARQSMISDIVPGERLMNAIALNSSGTNVMRLAGPPVGGVLLAIMGAGYVYVAMATLYAIGAACLLPVRSHPDAVASRAARKSARDGKPKNLKGMLSDLGEGCKYMLHDRVIFVVLGVSFMIVLLSQPYQMMLPGFAKDVLDASPSQLGFLMSLTGFGALTGSLVVASMTAKKRGVVLLSSALIMGVTIVAFSISTNIYITGVIVFAIGIGQSLRMSLSNVLIQTYTDPEYRGRVMSVYMMEFSLVAFGTFLIGILSNAVGVQVAMACTGIGLIILAVASVTCVPRMRRLD
jgi:MFS family permease